MSQTQMRSTQHGRGQTLQTWDSCATMIVCADNPDDAQEFFDSWLHSVSEGENPVQIEIKKLVAAQFLEQMLTETGHERIDWTQISNRVEPTVEVEEGDNPDPGYWADVNQLVRPNRLSTSLEALKTDLAEDIQSGLNWSAERQFFFILSVLSPPPTLVIPDSVAESSPTDVDDTPGENASETEIRNPIPRFPNWPTRKWLRWCGQETPSWPRGCGESSRPTCNTLHMTSRLDRGAA